MSIIIKKVSGNPKKKGWQRQHRYMHSGHRKHRERPNNGNGRR